MKVGTYKRVTTPNGSYVIYRERNWYNKPQYTYYKIGDKRGSRCHVLHSQIKHILKYKGVNVWVLQKDYQRNVK